MRKTVCIYSALLFTLFTFISCSKKADTKFELLSPSHTNIHFSNDVESTPEFNIVNYLYFYDGGGVAVGDINNNGLPDLFFVGNEVENRLYLNKGNFEFEDITEQAGIINDEGSWSTGVTMADVTGNGYLDIYVSRVNYLNKSGPNQLFINNGDLTFTELAADYGLDFVGYSTQAAFFDYNNNGRLDLFLLNHSFHGEDTYGPADILRQRRDPKAGDRLFRNDGDYFTDVTEEAGIISSALGYGLGLAITDINQNGLQDIYVGNDFHEDDYLYINNGDGTFTEAVYDVFAHTSSSSMGNDLGDINNNGLMDVVSLDMMPDDHQTFMRSGGPDLVAIANAKKNFGFGEKSKRNTLQINRGFVDGLPVFSETAFASGVATTYWSWAALFADYNNDGLNDLFITNGLPHRPNDLDYVAALQQVRQQYTGDELAEQEFRLIDMMPPVFVPNYMFKNNGDLTFSNVNDEWGFAEPTYSSGAVYADLNNNGRLDLVVNNTNGQPFIYRNTTADNDSTNYLKVKLNGSGYNTTGIGSKVFLYHGEDIFYREQNPTRGFQSSVDHVLHFGLAERTAVDSLLVIWTDGSYQTLHDVSVNQTLELHQTDAGGSFDYSAFHRSDNEPLFTDVTNQKNVDHRHRENTFDDFGREPLMPYKLSTEGPAFAVGDVNGNGLDDYYIGGARDFPGKLFLQNSDGTFTESEQADFISDRRSEDVDAIFFDATSNGYPDLYVVSGGNEFTGNSHDLLDRLYINQEDGTFRRSINSVPEFMVNGSVVRAADFNGNGHLDLFVGGHSVPWRYGIGPRSFILENNGLGVFEDMTEEYAPDIETIGNVTSAEWIDHPDRALPDLVITGEWMPVHYFENRNGQLVKRTEEFGLEHLKGLWQTVKAEDLTGNGHQDLILGNFGINSRIQATQDSPMNLYVNDFDNSGQPAPIITYYVDGEEKPFEQLDELMTQLQGLTQRVRSYNDYSQKNIRDIFDSQKLDEALMKEIREVRSLVLLNDGNGRFQEIPLPFEAQLFPVKTIYSEDFTGNGHKDILLAGNLFGVKPSMGGSQNAGHGLLLTGDGTGKFEPVLFQESGFFVKGQARSIQPINFGNGTRGFLVARNNDRVLMFHLNSD
jgi:enediyne biosynthesis protein E4